MITVEWPLYRLLDNDNVDDDEVCDWLEELAEQSPGELVFKYKIGTLYFCREEDAVAFKLKFGL